MLLCSYFPNFIIYLDIYNITFLVDSHVCGQRNNSCKKTKNPNTVNIKIKKSRVREIYNLTSFQHILLFGSYVYFKILLVDNLRTTV